MSAGSSSLPVCVVRTSSSDMSASVEYPSPVHCSAPTLGNQSSAGIISGPTPGAVIHHHHHHCNTETFLYFSMCHVQAEICRGGGPNYVTEGGCHTVKTLIQKALNTGSTLSTGECEVAGTCPGWLYSPYAFYFLTDRQTAYIDSSCGAQLRPIMGFLDVIPLT